MMKTNVKLTATITIAKEVFDEMNTYLKDGDDRTIHNLKDNNTLFSVRANFSNGYEGVIEVFTGDKNVLATTYLYDAEHNEVDYIETDDCLHDGYSFETKIGVFIIQLNVVF